MGTNQLSFEFDGTPPPTPAPPCGLCGRPRRWVTKRAAYALYCTGAHCDSPTRICRQCGTTYSRDTGGTYYCTPECREIWHDRRTPRKRPPCAWCGRTDAQPQQLAGGHVCAECLTPIGPVIGRLRQHHVHMDMVRRFASDPVCDICGMDVVTPRRIGKDRQWRVPLVVDHDHDCCPGPFSCGRCVRGLTCSPCNTMLGHAHNNPEILEQAAAYLRSARLRHTLPP